MTTIKELIQKANRETDGQLAGRLSDFLRSNYGLNYQQQVELWGRCGVSPERFENLMWYADYEH